jgi:hypothetical protein
MNKLILTIVSLSLISSSLGARSHELNLNEKDSGKYVSKVKVRDYYYTSVDTGVRDYDRSTITFKYDGKEYTVKFEKQPKWNLTKAAKKIKTEWSSNPALVVN